jgi:hypothetical protein
VLPAIRAVVGGGGGVGADQRHDGLCS